jgi:hypothetical protein
MRFTALLAIAILLAGCDPPEYDLAIKNVTVVDAVSGTRSEQTVLTRADTIAAILPANESARALRVVDGSGGYLIPGLWDFHVHLTYDDADADEMARLFLDYGVTSVRDTGGLLELVQPVVERLEEAEEAPRVFFAGPLLDGRDVVYDGESRPEIGISNPDPGAAEASIGRLAAAGVDFVKVYELVSPEVFGALVAAANAYNLPIAGHVPLSMLASEAGPQLGSMEHLRNVDLDCASNYLELLDARRAALTNSSNLPGFRVRSSLHAAQRIPAVQNVDADRCSEVVASLRSTIQVPTLRLNALSVSPPYARPDWPDALTRLGGEQAEAYRTLGESRLASTDEVDTTFGHWSLHLTGLMQGAGVPIGAGTDTPIGMAIPGYSLHNELSMLVQAGLDPVDALRAATVRPAEFFGLSGEMGQVATGMRADLVLLAGNPLEDIAHTRSIRMVVSKGRIVRQSD